MDAYKPTYLHPFIQTYKHACIQTNTAFSFFLSHKPAEQPATAASLTLTHIA